MPDHDPLDRLESHATLLAEQMTWEQQNRRGLLWVHGIIGLTAGVQMLLWGSATTIEASLGVWSRALMAGLGFTGGLLLAYGLSRRPRSVPAEAAGLCLVGVWDALMLGGLAYARWHQHDFRIIPLDSKLPEGYVAAYPLTVYGGLFALICIHLWTLRKIRRARR